MCPLFFKTAVQNVCASAWKQWWEAKSEHGNAQDAFAVAVLKDEAIIGHVPQKISAACSMFLHRDSSILCQVAESKHYSADQAQGGLEIPCIWVFIGSDKDTARVNSSQNL